MDEISKTENFEIILKEGWVEKRSRFIKQWRSRWMVLTPNFLFTFKSQQEYKNPPTEQIRLEECFIVKSAVELKKEFAFKVGTKNRTFYCCALDLSHKISWIGMIGKGMAKQIKKSNTDELSKGYLCRT